VLAQLPHSESFLYCLFDLCIVDLIYLRIVQIKSTNLYFHSVCTRIYLNCMILCVRAYVF